MKIYIDKDFKCYAAPAEGLTAVETEFFDGKAPDYIAGYRYVPEGSTWVREDGVEFAGEMVCPWKPWAALDGIQRAYERAQMAAFAAQNDELVNTIAEMVEAVYERDLEEMEA